MKSSSRTTKQKRLSRDSANERKLLFIRLTIIAYSLIRSRKERRQSSVSSSRFSTPIPSQMRDQEMTDDSNFYGVSPYDEFGPYDIDATSAAGPSRPTPLPYDDPYQDVALTNTQREPSSRPRMESHNDFTPSPREAQLNTSRGRREIHGRSRGRGRGRGGVPSSGNRIPGNRQDYGNRRRSEGISGGPGATNLNGETQSHHPRSLSPTSMAIASATGQMPTGSSFSTSQSTLNTQHQISDAFPFQATFPNHSFTFTGATPNQQFQPYVHPHINPRFASALGFHLSFMQQQQQQQTQQQQYSPVEHLAGVFPPSAQAPYSAPQYASAIPGDWSRNAAAAPSLQRETAQGQNIYSEGPKEESQ